MREFDTSGDGLLSHDELLHAIMHIDGGRFDAVDPFMSHRRHIDNNAHRTNPPLATQALSACSRRSSSSGFLTIQETLRSIRRSLARSVSRGELHGIAEVGNIGSPHHDTPHLTSLRRRSSFTRRSEMKAPLTHGPTRGMSRSTRSFRTG